MGVFPVRVNNGLNENKEKSPPTEHRKNESPAVGMCGSELMCRFCLLWGSPVQGDLAHKKLQDPTVGLRLWPYGVDRKVGVLL